MGPENLTAKTLRAVKWTYLSTFLNAGLQVLVTAVLARLVAPEAFGLVAMGSLVLRFGQYFAQMGVGQAIVQRQELRQEHLQAGFWASVIIGAVFSAAAWFGAPLGAAAFNSPRLTEVLRVMGLIFFLNGTSSLPLGILRREMRFREIALADVGTYAVGYAGVGVGAAVAGLGVWSLVLAALCQAGLNSLAYNLLQRPVLTPILRWRPYRELLGFGSMVSIVSFVEFINSNLDNMTVGRFAGSSALGYYSRALSLTGLPMYYISTSLSRVLFPSFSRVQEQTGRLRNAYLGVTTVFAALGLPLALGMSGAAREIILVLLGSRWEPAVPVMRLAAMASGVAMLSHFGGVTLEATARLRDKLLMRAGQFVLFGTALFSLRGLGLPGYALAFALSEVSYHLAQMLRIATLFDVPWRELGRAYWPGLWGGAAAFACLALESRLGMDLKLWPVVVLVVQILSGVLILTVVVFRIGYGRVFGVLHSRLGSLPAGSGLKRVVVWSSRLAAYDVSKEVDRV